MQTNIVANIFRSRKTLMKASDKEWALVYLKKNQRPIVEKTSGHVNFNKYNDMDYFQKFL